MNLIRSAIYNIVLFSILIVFLIFGFSLILFDKKYMLIFWKCLSRVVAFVTKHVAGISYTIENPPCNDTPPRIYAMRHESMWETFVLIHVFKQPIFIVKKELLDIPLFGVMVRKVGTIAVDRDGGARTLVEVTKKVEQAIAEGCSVVLFPEGTRVASGEHAELKRGIAMFYKRTNCPVVPVIHNAGEFWPRRGFIKKPGHVSVKFLDPISPGLHQGEFMEKLTHVFHTEVDKLKNE